MPLYRRLPKKGFSNHPFQVRFEGVNVGDLERGVPRRLDIDLEALRGAPRPQDRDIWKLLGDGTLDEGVHREGARRQRGRQDEVESAGGASDPRGQAHGPGVAGAERRENLAARAEISLEPPRAEVEKAAKARAEKRPGGAKAPEGGQGGKASPAAPSRRAAASEGGSKGGEAEGGDKARAKGRRQEVTRTPDDRADRQPLPGPRDPERLG